MSKHLQLRNSSSSQSLRMCACVLLSLWIIGLSHESSRLFAQEKAIVEEEPAAQGQAPAAAKPEAAAEEPSAQPDTVTIESRTFLQVLVSGLGPVFFPVFLLISVVLVALVVMNILLVRRENLVPVDLVEDFDNHVKERRYQEAYDLVKNNDSFLGRVLAAGLAKLSSGYTPALETMQEVGEEENMKLEHRLSYISLIGTISPMIGLFGTVYGMMDSFGEIRAAGNVTPKPSDLAAGIETALTTTLVGLFLAIPAIIAYGLLRNLVARRVLEVGIVSEGLMSRFSNVGRRPASGAPAGGGPTTGQTTPPPPNSS